MTCWISVEDKKPDLQKNYIFFNSRKEVTFGFAFEIDDEGGVIIHDLNRETHERATHWIQLEAPQV